MLLFRLSGMLLLRFVERKLIGLLFHDLPRSKRGSITEQRAWCTTRSLNGAALIFRRVGSRTMKFR